MMTKHEREYLIALRKMIRHLRIAERNFLKGRDEASRGQVGELYELRRDAIDAYWMIERERRGVQ